MMSKTSIIKDDLQYDRLMQLDGAFGFDFLVQTQQHSNHYKQQPSMNRNQNKIYNTQSNTQYQRKFISPTQLRSSDANKPTKTQEYRSPQHPIHSKNKEDPSQKIQKNKSQMSNEAPSSRSTTQKDKSNNHVSPHPDRSRSKEKKDYMTSNLARLNRKKQEKQSNSNVSDRSNPPNASKQKKQRYIYTFKEEIKAKNNEQVNMEYTSMPSSIDKVQPSPLASQITPLPSSNVNKSQKQDERSLQQGDTSEIRSNNTSVAMSSKGKPIEVNVIKYEERGNFKKQPSLKQIAISNRQELQYPPPQLSQPQVAQQSSKRLPIPINEPPKQQPIYPNPREDFTIRIRRLQSQKSSLQQSNARLIQQKYQMQGQLSLLSTKCQQFQRQLSQMHEAATRSGKQAQRTSTSNQRMFLELEERYNSLLQEYRAKAKQITQMSVELTEMQRHAEQLKNALRSAEEDAKNRGLEVDKTRKVYQARVIQLKQEHEFQLKQIQMRNTDQNKQGSYLQEGVRQLQRELAAKNKEISIKQREIEDLAYQVRDMEELAGLLKVKQGENEQLLSQLNKTKQLLYLANANHGEAISKISFQLKQKEKRIKQLLETATQQKNKQQMQRLSLSAQSQFYNPHQTQQGSFQQFIRSQSEQTNMLRADLAARDELVFKLSTEGDQLRERLRRVEQEVQLNARTYASNLTNITQVKQATEMMLKKRITALQALRTVPH